jgi:hypothetical protein
MDRSRRAVLAALGTAAVAGCLGRGGGPGLGGDPVETVSGTPPIGDRDLPLPDDTDALADSLADGGVGQDGIPSIDEPSFADPSTVEDWLEGGEPVFGVVRDGEAKAYPQRVLVHHEIVNDAIGGDPVSVTYCPLTGTAQGFERGEVTFGVSGLLLNSNLVMYDRGTESRFPQMLATGISGPHEGDTLREFPVTWTTWERWREQYPETRVLTRETGYVRNYGADPYGGYNPASGHYADENLPFEPDADAGAVDLLAKDAVIGARSGDGGVAVSKDRLRTEGIVETTVGTVPYVVVHDPALDTGYVYRNPDERAVKAADGSAVRVDGEPFAPADLPLERVLRFDAMWFAWGGYYPDSVVVT